jgi:1-phosphatidylinositol-4-phosphate 5-kinase
MPALQSNLQHGDGEYTGPVYSYTGEYRSGVKHGNGVIVFKSGNRYEGTFANDVMHGKGTFSGINSY